MKRLATIMLSLFVIVSACMGQWTKRYVDSKKVNSNVDVGDVNGDNLPDLLPASFSSEKFEWYENTGSDWIPHTIDSTNIRNKLTFAWFADVNVDGKLDVVACLGGATQLVWYENNYPEEWIEHTIDNGTEGIDFMIVADIDGNDTMDVLGAGGLRSSVLIWYENKHPDWIPHYIDSNWNSYPTATVADFDKDGLLDVGTIIINENKVVWYKNEGNGTKWTQHVIDDNVEYGWYINSGDFDGDDTIDVVASTGFYYLDGGGDLLWYKNKHAGWIKDTIDKNQEGFNLSVSDVNGDGSLDIVADVLKSPNVCWYENNNTAWTKHVIDNSMGGLRLNTMKDIDGDGVDDIVVAGGDYFAWYKNPYTPHAYPKSIMLDPYCKQSPGDTLKFVATLSNPENHQVSIYTVIKGKQIEYIDTLKLFDDGAHYDGDSADNTLGNFLVLEELPEGLYSVDFVTHDISSGPTHYYYKPTLFNNFGPVELEDYSFSEPGDTILNPGDRLKFYLVVINKGSTASATGIEAGVTSLDPGVSVSTLILKFDDISPGDTSVSNYRYWVEVENDYPVNTDAEILVNIYGNNHMCWSDTLSILVLESSTAWNLSKSPSLDIFPNPSEDFINIELEKKDKATIEMYDINGRLVFNKEYDSKLIKIDLSGLLTGLYFVKVMQHDDVYINKVMVR